MNTQQDKVWIVTGTSGGLGLAIVETLLKHGLRVAAFSRNGVSVEKAVGHGETENFIALSVQLQDEQSVIEAKKRVLDKFGTVDVVVNNAGHGQRGAVEEVTDEELRKVFDDNFFSQLNMIRQFMPVMRVGGGGYFINLGSVGSFKAKPCAGAYCATKYAVNALTKAINQEGAAFNVRATCVKPFDLRTNYLAAAHLKQPRNVKECYQEFHIAHDIDDKETHGGQPGDPIKVAELFIQLAEEKRPPCSLFLDYPVEDLIDKIMSERWSQWKEWAPMAASVEY